MKKELKKEEVKGEESSTKNSSIKKGDPTYASFKTVVGAMSATGPGVYGKNKPGGDISRV